MHSNINSLHFFIILVSGKRFRFIRQYRAKKQKIYGFYIVILQIK